MNDVTLTGDQFILFALLIKMGVMAGLATLLVTSSRFKRLLFEEDPGPAEKMKVSLLLAFFFAFGVAARVLIGYVAVDLSLPGVFLIGLLAGPGPGAIAGAVIAVPAVFYGEFLALPFFAGSGAAAGFVHDVVQERSVIWSFSPMPFVNVYRYLKSAIVARKVEGQLLIFVSLLGLDVVHNLLAGRYPELIFDLKPRNFGVLVCMYLATLTCVGIPLKILNNTWLEEQLEQRELRLMEARYLALKSQINPHFLFNTLNSISSCLGTEPQKARWILLKLSEILRRLLRSEDYLVPLSRELDFIDSYLQIETIRFGEEKLRVVKEIDPRVLSVPVPGMILQPLVENALKHGIAPLLHGGVLEIRARKEEGKTIVEIIDNGRGMREDRSQRGIGIKNVSERLRMVYGAGEWFRMERVPEGGTRVEIRIPAQPVSMVEAGSR
jgi:two-component system LytT family sensor kinase